MADIPDEGDEDEDAEGASVAVVDTQAEADEVDAEHVIVRESDETDADTDADDDGVLDTPLSDADMTVGELGRHVARTTIGALEEDGMLADDAFDGTTDEDEGAEDDADPEPPVESLGASRGFQ